jgi:hypothetical protein
MAPEPEAVSRPWKPAASGQAALCVAEPESWWQGSWAHSCPSDWNCSRNRYNQQLLEPRRQGPRVAAAYASRSPQLLFATNGTGVDREGERPSPREPRWLSSSNSPRDSSQPQEDDRERYAVVLTPSRGADLGIASATS